jgi:flagellar motor protein MotB
LRSADIKNWVEGKKLYISLKGQVGFDRGCPDPANTTCKYNDDLSPENQANLRKVAKIIASQQGWNRFVIEGRADSTPYRDPQTRKIAEDSAFRNFDLSSRRAMQVLKFFHQCPGCDKSYDVNAIRPKLALSGLGSKTDSGEIDGDNQDERRVDVVLDYSEGLK